THHTAQHPHDSSNLVCLLIRLIRTPPTSPLFPYTTLFRSKRTPISRRMRLPPPPACRRFRTIRDCASMRLTASRASTPPIGPNRSEEHTSELQSRENLVCRLLLEKKKIIQQKHDIENVDEW